MDGKNGKKTIGLVEPATLHRGDGQRLTIYAKIDTGATKSSIDSGLVEELKLGPVIMNKVVKSAHGSKVRPVIKATLEIAGIKVTTQFTVADRTAMKYKVLIGQNILKNDFLIDPSR